MYATVEKVLDNLNSLIEEKKVLYVDVVDVYKDLSIFDWWVDRLFIHRLQDMQNFLIEAQKLGFNGYCCFKVGASECANGMWAYTEESKNGYSPDSDCLYKSFSPDYEYWNAKVEDLWLNDKYEMEFDQIETIEMLEALL